MTNNQNSSATSNHAKNESVEADRRAFLAACGKFAAVTPPSVALLLSTSLTSPAIAYSGAHGHHDNDHDDHGHHDNDHDDHGHHYGWNK